MYLEDIKYSEIKELIEFLKSLSNDDEFSLFHKFSRFFYDLGAAESFALMNFIIDPSEERFDEIITVYPSLKFDPKGLQKPSSTLTGFSSSVLDDLYENSKIDMENSAGKVIREAKDLQKLGNYNTYGKYLPERTLYLKKQGVQVTKADFNMLEELSLEMFGKNSKLPERVIYFMKEHSFRNAAIFLNHLILRMSNVKNDKTSEYYEKLNKIAL